MSHSCQETSLAGLLGQSPFSDDEIAALRKRAWVEQGLLIIRPSDPKLTIREVQVLLEIGQRLYGGAP